MLFLSDIHNTSSAEFYDTVCIAHSLGYNTAFKRTYFQELPGILEKRFSSCHNKKVQANNIDLTGVAAWMNYWTLFSTISFYIYHKGFPSWAFRNKQLLCSIQEQHVVHISCHHSNPFCNCVLIFPVAVCVSVSEREAKT